MKTNNVLNNNGLTHNLCKLTSFIKLFCECFTIINLNIKQSLDKYLKTTYIIILFKKFKALFSFE